MLKDFAEYNKQRKGLKPEFYSDNPALPALVETTMAMSTEVNEIMENIMRARFRGEELDIPNIKEELGDMMWYIGEFVQQLGLDFMDILEMNVEKLEKRYSNGFDPKESKERDLKNERGVFE